MSAPEPFVSVDGVTLYHGDARELLPTLQLPDDAGWIIDPPWDENVLVPHGARRIVFCDGHRQRDAIAFHGPPTWIFTWDCVSSWYTKNRPLRRAKYALWYGIAGEYVADGALHGGDRSHERARVVSNSRGAYLFQADTRGKHLSDVFSAPITALHSRGGHKHEKPLEWVMMLIANCLAPCSVIVDPFAGSGSTLDACRAIGKRCIAIEIDMGACEQIRDRLSQAVLIA